MNPMRFVQNTKVVRRMRTKSAAEGTYKAFQQFKGFLQKIRRKYSKEVIVFQRKNLIEKWDMEYDLSNSIYANDQIHFVRWAVLAFAGSAFASYGLSLVWHDRDIQYYFYITYPKQMRLFDRAKDKILFHWNIFLSKLPFGGDIPDITRPENYNRFKRELKNYLFRTEEKQRLKEEIKQQIQQDSQVYDKTLQDLSKYMEDQTRKIIQIKVKEE